MRALAFATVLVIPAGLAAADPAEVSHVQAVGGLFNTCTGELVDFTGTARLLDKPNADGSFKSSLTIHGVGTGSLGNETWSTSMFYWSGPRRGC